MAAVMTSRSYQRKQRQLSSSRCARAALRGGLLSARRDHSAPLVETPGTRTELGEEERAAEHGDVLHEHYHLHLLHHRIGDSPEFVHWGDRDQKEDNEPCAQL